MSRLNILYVPNRRKMKVECSIEGCTNEGLYALYQLRPDMTKVWRTDLCDSHERWIAGKNTKLRAEHQTTEFKEVVITEG